MPGEWGAFLADTMTGERLTDLSLVGDGSWSIELNKIPTGSFTVATDQLDTIDRRQWTYLRGSVYFMYRSWSVGTDGITRPGWSGVWCGGPIISEETYDRQAGTSSFTWAGIRHMLTGRLALTVDVDHPDEDQIRRSVWTRSGMSLGTIAEELVLTAMQKPNGSLPISFNPALRETAAADDGHTRTYPGYDLANIAVDKLLTELCEVAQGPDMMFRPRWVDDTCRAVTNDFVHGLEAQPNIPQHTEPVFDLTAVDSDVAAITVTASDSARTVRAFATGAGDGEGIALQLSTDRAQLDQGMPIWESVQSYQSVADPATLYAHAVADNDRGATPILQINATVDASAPSALLGGGWQVGDIVKVTTRGERLIADGDHRLLILKASGSFSTDLVQLELQEVG